MHPDYNPYTFEADLAVVELAQSVNFDQYKQPIGKSNFSTRLKYAQRALNITKITFNKTFAE